MIVVMKNRPSVELPLEVAGQSEQVQHEPLTPIVIHEVGNAHVSCASDYKRSVVFESVRGCVRPIHIKLLFEMINPKPLLYVIELRESSWSEYLSSMPRMMPDPMESGIHIPLWYCAALSGGYRLNSSLFAHPSHIQAKRCLTESGMLMHALQRAFGSGKVLCQTIDVCFLKSNRIGVC